MFQLSVSRLYQNLGSCPAPRLSDMLLLTQTLIMYMSFLLSALNIYWCLVIFFHSPSTPTPLPLNPAPSLQTVLYDFTLHIFSLIHPMLMLHLPLLIPVFYSSPFSFCRPVSLFRDEQSQSHSCTPGSRQRERRRKRSLVSLMRQMKMMRESGALSGRHNEKAKLGKSLVYSVFFLFFSFLLLSLISFFFLLIILLSLSPPALTL